ncbi:MAG: DUF389 domain-containing protein, partial [Candidatus Saccharimonadales bacterium]
MVAKLITHSTPSQDFYFMIVLAMSVAALGLLLNNVAVVIGSMLISPMLYAFLGTALGLGISDTKLIGRSLASIVKAAIAGIVVAAFITVFIGYKGVSSAALGQFIPSLSYGMVALLAGAAAAFTLTKPLLNETLPGVAITVSIVPPIAATGIGLATFQWPLFRDSLMLFVLNTVAIVAGALIVFLLVNMYGEKSVAEQTLKKEQKKIVLP